MITVKIKETREGTLEFETQEEYDAWDRGFRLAKRLKIPIDENKYYNYASKCFIYSKYYYIFDFCVLFTIVKSSTGNLMKPGLPYLPPPLTAVDSDP